MGFENAFNKFAKFGNTLNRGVNNVIGKEVFKDIKEMEPPREFPSYSSFPEYAVPEPEQWSAQTGEDKQFTLCGNVINVSANLDACIKYRKFFISSAKYYSEKFKFKYQNCVQDFDSLVNYFPEMYLEGLTPMAQRAYSLLLPFGVFSADIETFTTRQTETYKRAITSYQVMVGTEATKNQSAKNLGNKVGGTVQMRGGGFGFKGAMKGMAKAEAFNLGMGVLGKLVEHQGRMSAEEKANAFAKFKTDIFFKEVYSDYANTFLTMAQTLSENHILVGVKTVKSKEVETMILNLQNPMFPQDKIAPALAQLISTYPFEQACFELLQQKIGNTEEVNRIINYFLQ